MEGQPVKAPLIGVGVVVVKATAAGPRVLLVKRGKAPRAGQWSIPGGHQELGETLRAGAAREVLEETGVEVEIIRLLDAVDSINRGEDGRLLSHYSLIDFMGIWRAGDPKAASDAAEAIWADPDDLDSFGLWSETRRIIALALAEAEGGPVP